MGIVVSVVIGLLAGVATNLIYPGPSRAGMLGAMGLAIAGALFGSAVSAAVAGRTSISEITALSMLLAALGTLPCCFAITPWPVHSMRSRSS